MGERLMLLRNLLRAHGPLATLCVILGIPFAVPVVMLVVGAFRTKPPGLGGDWSFSGFIAAYSDPVTYSTLGNSLILASSVTAISIVLGVFLAWVATRTNTPGRWLITPVMLLVFAIPALFIALGWQMLANDPAGLLNKAVDVVFNTTAKPFDVNSWRGLIGVNVLKMTSAVYLLVLGPMRSLDSTLTEASLASGAGKLRTYFRVEVPLLAPAISGIAILTFVVMLSVLDIPLIIGLPAGIFVYSSTIYGNITAKSPPEYNTASAMALLLILIVVMLMIAQRMTLRGRSFTTIGGKGRASTPSDIGWWRWLCLGVIGLYTLAAFVLPAAQLVLGSFQPVFGVYGKLTLDNYSELMSSSDAWQAILNSILIGVVAGLVAALLAVTISYIQRHSRSRLRRLPELTVWLILAMPGVVLSLAMVWAYVSIPGLRTLYFTVWMVIIALTVYVTPVALRASEGSVAQIGPELEEAARVSGASATRTLSGIVARLIAPSFLVAWVVGGLLAAGNLDVPILMSGPSNPSVPVLVYSLYAATANYSRAAAILVVFIAIFVAVVLLGTAAWLLVRFIRNMRRRSASHMSSDDAGESSDDAGKDESELSLRAGSVSSGGTQ